jgi:hypothetical protein
MRTYTRPRFNEAFKLTQPLPAFAATALKDRETPNWAAPVAGSIPDSTLMPEIIGNGPHNQSTSMEACAC